MTTNKNTLRQRLKAKLRDLSLELRARASQKITAQIIHSEIFVQSQEIACYIPIENEIDTWPIIQTIWHQGKNCYLPVLSPTVKNHLDFVRFMPNDPLFKTKQKFLIPKFKHKTAIDPQKLNLVILPFLGYNNNCYRLGRGFGCYDLTFNFKQYCKIPAPYLLGIGYKWQHIDFEPDPWDVMMDKIITA